LIVVVLDDRVIVLCGCIVHGDGIGVVSVEFLVSVVSGFDDVLVLGVC
jgi:hypothetical protein